MSLQFDSSKAVYHADTDCVRFVATSEGKLVPCAISRQALETIVGRPCFGGDDLIKCYQDGRDYVHAVARANS